MRSITILKTYKDMELKVGDKVRVKGNYQRIGIIIDIVKKTISHTDKEGNTSIIEGKGDFIVKFPMEDKGIPYEAGLLEKIE